MDSVEQNLDAQIRSLFEKVRLQEKEIAQLHEANQRISNGAWRLELDAYARGVRDQMNRQLDPGALDMATIKVPGYVKRKVNWQFPGNRVPKENF